MELTYCHALAHHPRQNCIIHHHITTRTQEHKNNHDCSHQDPSRPDATMGFFTKGSSPTFKQWTTAQDGLDKLTLGDAKLPSPKDGEVLVKIRAVSLNYRDTEGVCALHYTALHYTPASMFKC